MTIAQSTPATAEPVEQEVVVGVPFLQREAKLQQLLESAVTNPAIDSVVVADNGDESERDVYGDYGDAVDVLDLPFDAGIGACRAAVAKQTDAEYLVVVDSDMEIPRNIDTLVQILERDPGLGAVAGILEENGQVRAGVCDFHEDEHFRGRTALVQSIREDKSVEWSTGYPVARFDKLPNAMVVRRACVDDYGWDSDLKDKEHLDWFLGHYHETDWEFGVTPAVLFRHHTSRDNDSEYQQQFRFGNDERQQRYRERLLEKWDYDRVVYGSNRWFGTQRRPLADRLYKAVAADVPTRYSYPIKTAVEGVLR